jgi:hypothetical protein
VDSKFAIWCGRRLPGPIGFFARLPPELHRQLIAIRERFALELRYAFEQPVGDNPRHRHHVRFWKTEKATKKLMPTYVKYPPRQLQSMTYAGPITNSDYERFQHVREQLEKQGVQIPWPTGNWGDD